MDWVSVQLSVRITNGKEVLEEISNRGLTTLAEVSRKIRPVGWRRDEGERELLLTLLRLLINALVIFAVAHMVRGVAIKGYGTAIVVSIVLGLLNILVRPILILLTLPITVVTLGLFIFVLNALLLWVVSSLVPGFEIQTFSAALVSAFLISVGSVLVSFLV
jgi:putative membrane protein